MISLFASMITTCERFLAYEITDVPAVFVHRIPLYPFLPFPFDSRQGGDRTADPIALVFTAAAQREARSIAENFRVCPALVPVTFYVLRGGAASTWTDYPDPTRRTRPDMTRRRTGMRAIVKLL